MSNEMLMSIINTPVDYRNLSEIERKLFIQTFIDSIHYDSERFKAAADDLRKWKESYNENKTESNG